MSVVIFSGNNDRSLIAFCRYARGRKIQFDIIANGVEDSIFLTTYKAEVFAIRERNYIDVSSVIDWCAEIRIKRKISKVLILPTSEFLNRFFLKNQAIWFEHGIETGLCNRETYELISDKYTFSNYCRENGCDVPEEYSVKPNSFPFVIKPKRYANNSNIVYDKPIIIQSELDWKDNGLSKSQENYYYQDFIEGSSFYLLYYFSRDGKYVVYSQENLIQQHDGCSMILCKSSDVHQQEIAKKYADIFLGLGFWGLVMVELKYSNRKYYMIEANPRFWGPMQLTIDSNMKIIDYFISDNDLYELQEINEEPYKVGVYYFWSGGLIQTLSIGKAPIFYNYNCQLFFQEYREILMKEVYFKEDTNTLYLKENNLNEGNIN